MVTKKKTAAKKPAAVETETETETAAPVAEVERSVTRGKPATDAKSVIRN